MTGVICVWSGSARVKRKDCRSVLRHVILFGLWAVMARWNNGQILWYDFSFLGVMRDRIGNQYIRVILQTGQYETKWETIRRWFRLRCGIYRLKVCWGCKNKAEQKGRRVRLWLVWRVVSVTEEVAEKSQMETDILCGNPSRKEPREDNGEYQP